MFRSSIVPGLQFYGDADHVAGSYEDDGTHAGHRLEPCPFCGSTRLELRNTHTPSYWIACRKCDAEMHGNLAAGAGGHITSDRDALRFHLRAMRSAVRKWNKRVIEDGHPDPCAAHRASDADDLRRSIGEALSAKLYELMDNSTQAFDACDAYNIDMLLDEVMPLIEQSRAKGKGREA